jgi:pimeloyl-ACP methyl ester carboxylesterase
MSTATDARGPQPAVVSFHLAPAPVRATFGLLERAAPGLGARWARRIWFTIPGGNGGRPAAGARSGPGGALFTIPTGSGDVVGEVWGEGPAVFLVHGWAGRRGQLAAFVEPLVARGYRVVTFDAPSHGDSPPGASGPRASSLPEFATALSAVVATYGPAHAVIAHSLGASAAATALRDGLRPGRLAMLAPAASMVSYAGRFITGIGAGERIHGRLAAAIERRLGVPLESFDVPAIGREVLTPPTLVVHDQDDPSIPAAEGAAIAAAWPGARLSVTSGLGHRRILRDPRVVADVVDFVTAG